MKTMKRFASALLALVMIMGMAVTSYADEATYTLTLDGAQSNHTYAAYQIFAGDLSGNTLSNIVWGSGVNTNANGFNLGNAATKAESLKTTADAEAFAAEVAPYLGTAAGSVTIADKATSGTITGLEAGYYLIETTATPDKDGVKTYYIMKVVKDTEATIKAGVPSVDKTVNDNDANIGDTVTFTLTATMPSNIQGYETYKVIFHDTMSAGLTFGEITDVTVAGTKVTSGYELSPETPVAGEEFTITFANVLADGIKATAGSTIEVKYTATLNSNAVIGTDGNLNEVYLEYSNDPNWNGEGNEPTGDTPEKEVKVYTWEIPVFKYTGSEENKVALPGAGFTLYKGATAIKLVDAGNGIYKVCNIKDCAEAHHIADNQIMTGESGKFEIEGLEKGTYILKETKTPDGYNTCADVTVVIGDNGALTQDGKSTTEVGILNQSGATLPETGGIGTTIFYAMGAALMLGAGVLLVTKKRMGE